MIQRFISERTLLKRCLENDKRAWDAFVERYNRVIYSAILHTLKKYSFPEENQIIDDLFQTVFLSLIEFDFKKLRQFKGKCKLSSWLHIISVRMTIDFLRKKKKQLSLNGDTDEEKSIKEGLTNGKPLPDDLLDQKDDQKLFEMIKNQLNARERLFVELFYVKELSPAEVSKIMNITQNNVYQIKNRVRNKMAKIAKDLL